MKFTLPLGLILLMVASCSTTPEADQPSGDQTTVTSPVSPESDAENLLPDLLMDYAWEVRYTSDCPWGGPGYVIMRGRNIGEADAGSFYVRIWDHLELIEELPYGEQVDVRVDFESGPVGSIPATIDSEEQVEESDENNNEVLIVFTPPPKCTPEG